MNFLKPKHIILVGASTGGPGLIEDIVTSLGEIDGVIIFAQHMDGFLLESFAKRLNRINTIDVILVKEKTSLERGKIYLLYDTSYLQEERDFFYLSPDKKFESFYHPTIDRLFSSASSLSGVDIYAYILSGIGSDGTQGMLSLKKNGYKTIVQDEKTSIVYGMPKSAFEASAAQKVLSFTDIVSEIKQISHARDSSKE